MEYHRQENPRLCTGGRLKEIHLVKTLFCCCDLGTGNSDGGDSKTRSNLEATVPFFLVFESAAERPSSGAKVRIYGGLTSPRASKRQL